MKSGIYKIVVGDKFYFGSSNDMPRRFSEHRQRLRAKKHKNPIMQRCWDKYGEAAFTFEVVDTCPPEETLEVEQRYLDLVVGVPGCMNIATEAGGGRLGRPHSAETCRKLSELHKGKPLSMEHRRKLSEAKKGKRTKGKAVGAFAPDGTLLNSWPSATLCALELGAPMATVASWCTGARPQPGPHSRSAITKHLHRYSPGIQFWHLDK